MYIFRTWIDGSNGFGPRNREVPLRIRIPTLRDDQLYGPENKKDTTLCARMRKTRASTNPGFWTTSLNTRTASSLVMFSKLTSFTWRIMSPGSMRPSSATAPLHSYRNAKLTTTTWHVYVFFCNFTPSLSIRRKYHRRLPCCSARRSRSPRSSRCPCSRWPWWCSGTWWSRWCSSTNSSSTWPGRCFFYFIWHVNGIGAPRQFDSSTSTVWMVRENGDMSITFHRIPRTCKRGKTLSENTTCSWPIITKIGDELVDRFKRRTRGRGENYDVT